MSSFRWSRLFLAAFAAAAALALPSSAAAQTTVPTGFQESVAINNLSNPIAVQFASDGRVFVAEQNGRIKVFDNLQDTSATIFADLSTKVHNFWDRGLLGLALAPNFPADPHVYALYTHDAAIGGTAPRWGTGTLSDGCPTPPGATDNGCVVSGRLSRLTANGNVMTGTEQVLVEGWCQQFPSHSVGALAFGADGALYASAGDGASFNFPDYGQRGNPCGDPPGTSSPTPPTAEGGALRAQDLRTTVDPVGLNGSVIRVDPATGAGLPDNPLALSSDANARRIVAYGMRNPFRITVRPGTNEVWVGDVGWNDFEEIDRITTPTDSTVDNFGWPCREGDERQDGYDDANLNICENLYTAGENSTAGPYYAYDHNLQIRTGEACGTGSSSITGLAFYEGGNYPGYEGGLFFADNARGCIWFMRRGANGLPDPGQIINFVSNHANPVDIQIGPGGDLFYVDYDNGQIRRIRYTGNNQAPTARALASPEQGPAPLTVQFDGTTSTDPEGSALTYEWDLDDDGAYDDSTAAQPTFTYTQSRQYTVRLRVRDTGGATGLDDVVINVGNNGAPVPTISTPSSTTTWKVGDTINFSGSATDPQDGTLPASALTWRLIMHHCPSNCHTHVVQDFTGVASGSFVGPDHEYPSHLELQLTATDSSGARATTSVLLQPRTVELTFRTSHPGLRLTVGATSATAPFTTTVIVGSSNSISAPSPQTVNGKRYTFASWSDGGAGTHNIVAPATATTYTASYDETVAPPVAAYAFDEGSGTSVADASGTGNGGAVSGATWSSQGRFGSALVFDGVDDRVTVPDAASLDLTTGMTLEAWVRPAALGTTWRTALFKAQTDNHVYALYANESATRPLAEAFVGGSVHQARGVAALALDQWTHLTSTYDGTTLRLYVNGALAASTPLSGSLTTSDGELWIGGNPIWNEWFQGLIDEIRIYDRALDAAEIQADMNRRVGVADTAAPTAPASLEATGGRGSVRLTWAASTDDVGVDHYNVHRSTTPGFTPTAANRIAQPTGTTYNDGGLAPGTYHYLVTAADAAGNVSPPSPAASATATADTTAPTVSVTEPAAGATVSGSLTLRATASDDDSVVGVQFKVDGANVGGEDTSAPYTAEWDSRSVANGTHTITAVARDPSANARTSDPVTVTVSNTAPPVQPGLVAAYAFDEGNGTGAADASGTGNGGALAGATWSANGRFGSALSFDGVDDRVVVADSASLDLTTGMTLEAWVRPTVAGSVWRTALAKESGDSVVYSLYSNRNTNVSAIEATVVDRLRTVNGTALPLNAWSHLAATYDGTTLRIFVNGTQAGAAAYSGALPTSAGELWIGGNPVWNEWFQGQIDEVRIYNRALSAADIQADMARRVGVPDTAAPTVPGNLQATGGRGSVRLTWSASSDDVGVHHYNVHRGTSAGFTPTAANRVAQPTGTSYTDGSLSPGTYYYVVTAADAVGNVSAASNEASGTATADTTPPTVSITQPAAGATVSGTVTLAATAGDDDAVASVEFKVDGTAVAQDPSAPFSAQWDSRAVPNGQHDITAVARDLAGNATTSNAVRITVNNTATPPPAGLVAAYGFGESTGPSVADASGTGNTGTISGATWAPQGRFGSALAFDGVDDRVAIADASSLDLTTGMTLEAWVRPTAAGGVWRTAVAKNAGTTVAYNLYANRNTNQPAVELNIASRLRTVNGTAQLPLNTWSHIAATYDGTTMRLFVNGAQVGAGTYAGSLLTSTGELWIGGNSVWNEWFAGAIDEVRVYNRALTAAQIQSDMAAPVAP